MIKHFIVECIRQEKHFKTMTISIETGTCEVTWDLFCNNDEGQVLGFYPRAKHILLYTFKKELNKECGAIHIKRNTSAFFTISVIFCDLKDSVYGYKAEFNKKIDKLTTTRNYYG